MNFPRPRILPSTLSSALEAGCDTVMLKHDGFPVSINCVGNEAVVFEDFRFGHPNPQRVDVVKIEPYNALLVGAKDRFSTRIHVYDIWWHDGQLLRDFSYRNRYAILTTVVPRLDPRFVPVKPYPIGLASELWKQVTKDTLNLKGLICRRSKDTAAGELYSIPFYPERPEALT